MNKNYSARVKKTIIGTREAAFCWVFVVNESEFYFPRRESKELIKKKILADSLYGEMPVVMPGTRGPEGVWCKRLRKKPTRIHVNQQKIKANGKRIKNDPQMTSEQLMPVIALKQTNRNDLGYQMEIHGPCRIVYKPYEPLSCGAHLWIETYYPVQFVDTKFKPVTARKAYKYV